LRDDRDQQETLDVGEDAARTADREGEAVTGSEEFVDDRDDAAQDTTDQTGLGTVEEDLDEQADLSGEQATTQTGAEYLADEQSADHIAPEVDDQTATTEIEFGGREIANEIRDRLPDGATTNQYNRRHKTIEVYDGVEGVDVDQLVREAADSKAQEAQKYGQSDLTDAELQRLDQRDDWNGQKRFHAQSAKGILRNGYGVDDWLSWYDPSLTVEEHHDVGERAQRTDRGQRFDEGDRTEAQLDEQLQQDRAVVQREACDNAADWCEDGDARACEHLIDECDWTEAEIEQLQTDIVAMHDQMDTLDTDDGGRSESPDSDLPQVTSEEIPPTVKRTLGRAWNGFRAAAGQAQRQMQHFEDYSQAREEARQYGAVINEIRQRFGQDPIDIEAEVSGEPIGLDDLPPVDFEWQSVESAPTADDVEDGWLQSQLDRLLGDVYDPTTEFE
jgi:hypothetical protein